MDILWRLGSNHHDLWLDLHLLHFDHELLVGIFLNLGSHDKPIFEEFVLFKKLLVTKCFLNFQHSLLLFFILGSFLDDEICVLSRVSLELKIERMTFVF